MEKYQNKYRIQSHRRPHWDYSEEGAYFITLVTQHRACHLGDIKEPTELSDWGKIVEKEWLRSFEIRKELILDEYVIMPNHIHAIIILDTVETHGRASLPTHNRAFQRIPIRLPQSISSFIACFKSAVNSEIDNYIDEYQLNIPKYNRKNHFFQPNYHDRIIRNDEEYRRIKNYIINNPLNWRGDKLSKHF